VDGKLPLFVASGIWSAMTPVHEENLERLEVSASCNAALPREWHESGLPAAHRVAWSVMVSAACCTASTALYGQVHMLPVRASW